MNNPSDTTLVESLRSGDYLAFKAIFMKYHHDMVQRSYQITKQVELSKDVAQEVFFELWKNHKKLPDSIVLEAYLRRSTINRTLNLIKSRKHHMGSGSEPLNHLQSKSKDPAELTEATELQEYIRAAIDSLPERCRMIFMLCKEDGMSHKEVAQKLGISTKTIENQITKALKSLRSAVKKYQALELMLWGIFIFQLLVS